MPLIGFTDRLDSIEENLLYKAQDGSYWLSGVCTFHQDAKGRTIVVQSVSKERYAAGEKGPQVGFWREIGSKDQAAAQGAPKASTWRNSRPLPRSTRRRATANTRQVRRDSAPRRKPLSTRL